MKIFKFLFSAIKYFMQISLVWVALYAVLPIPITPYQIQKLFEGNGLSKNWISYSDASKNIYRAVVGAEDGRFMRHKGIDWRAVKDAERYNLRKKGKKKRGASTITMQTAKNTFLLHHRNFFRKGLEVYFTVLIEEIWGKKRILEVYANVVEMGEGIYGFDKAAEVFFNKSGSNLSRSEAALIAAVLPNPIRWSPAKPTKYIRKRQAWIMGRMGVAIPKEEKE